MTAITKTMSLPRVPIRFFERYGIWLVLVGLLIIAGIASEAFFRVNYLMNIIRQASPIGITAVGVTGVMLLRGVDLSVGAVISATSVLCALLMNGKVENMVSALVITCAAGAVIGLVNGLIIAITDVSAFILTLGMSIVIGGIVQMESGGTAAGVVSPGFREFMNSRIDGILPVLAIWFLLMVALGVWLQGNTRFGRHLYLIGANPAAARLAGLPIKGVTVIAYALSGFMAALGGIALLARTGVSGTNSGVGYEFDVLAAVVLGGTTFSGGRGGAGGTLAGVLTLFIALNLANVAGLPFAIQLTIKGLIIIAASAIHSWIGRRGGARTV
jgi:ribose/xylose/arabinose/galactoside ABC-type transport system permease subunit